MSPLPSQVWSLAPGGKPSEPNRKCHLLNLRKLFEGIHRAGSGVGLGFLIEAARKLRATCRFGHLPRSADPTCGFARRRTNAPVRQTPGGEAWRWPVRSRQRNSCIIFNSTPAANASRFNGAAHNRARKGGVPLLHSTLTNRASTGSRDLVAFKRKRPIAGNAADLTIELDIYGRLVSDDCNNSF